MAFDSGDKLKHLISFIIMRNEKGIYRGGPAECVNKLIMSHMSYNKERPTWQVGITYTVHAHSFFKYSHNIISRLSQFGIVKTPTTNCTAWLDYYSPPPKLKERQV